MKALTKADLARALELTARLAWSLSVNHRGHAGTYEEMGDVQPGDLVIENSSLGIDIEHGRARIGRLLRVEREPIYAEDIDGNLTEGIQGYETVYYLKTLAGQEFRWTNCQFIRVPDCWQALDILLDGGDHQKRARRCPDCGAVWGGRPDLSNQEALNYAATTGWTQFDEKTRQCRNCKAGRPPTPKHRRRDVL